MSEQSDLEEFLAWQKYKRKLWIEQNKEKTAARKKIYYQNNKEKFRLRSMAWRKKNPDKLRATAAKFRAAHPEYSAINNRKRRALRAKVVSERYTVQQILEIYGTNCHICGGSIDLNAPRQVGKKGWRHALHIDHIIPLSKGGNDTIDNVRPAHGECNIRKHNK